MFVLINNKGEYYELPLTATYGEAQIYLQLLFPKEKIEEEEWEVVEE